MRFVGPDPLQSVVDPVGAQDAATKTYVDALVAARTLTPTAILTGAYAARPGQFARLNVSTGGVSVTLPSDAGPGQLVGVKKVDASGNTVQVTPLAPQKLDGTPGPLVLSSLNQTVLVAFDGTDWAVVATANIAGPAGATGPAGTVSVGTTTTGAAGGNAQVTNSGTAAAAVLNFTIPAGPAGPTGSFGSSWQGKFLFNVTYPPGSVVFHQGSTYLNTMTVTNGDYVPTEQLALAAPTSAIWKLVAKGYNNAGAYTSSTAYTGGDVVTYQGQVYLSIGYNNAGAGNSPTDASTNWVLWAAKGANGAAATVTVGTTTALAAGSTPAVTNAGTASAAVLNFAIPAGAAGTAGAAATVGVGTVTTGAAGSAAAVTNSGTAAAAVLNFTIPRGATGADGNPGTAATVTVGTVSTGSPGSAVTVTNTGSASAATLNFTIPAGAAGTPGTPGVAASVTVGTTTALGVGAAPSVTNSGSTSAAVLNFAIPAGATGAPGTAGAAATIAVGTVTTGAPGSAAAVTNAGSSSAAVLNFAIPAGAAATVTAGTATALPAGAAPTVTNTGSSSAAVLNFGVPAGATGAMGASPGTSISVAGSAAASYYYDNRAAAVPAVATSFTANMINYVPIFIAETTTVTALSVWVTTLALAGSARLGIYSTAAGTNKPGTLIVDAGTVATASTGQKVTAQMSTVLPGGVWYQLALHIGGAVSLYGVPATGCPNFTGIATNTMTTAAINPATLWGATSQTLAALAATPPATTAYYTTAPLIFIQAST